MNVYRFDDGAVYHVVAKTVREAFRALFDVNADDGWHHTDSVEWALVEPSEDLTINTEGGGKVGIDFPLHSTINGRGGYTATAEDWSDLCDKPCVLCCSEWP